MVACIFIQTNTYANPNASALSNFVTSGNNGMPHVYALTPDKAYQLGVKAYQNNYIPLSLTYLEPVCQAAPHAGLAAAKQAMACYIASFLHFQQHHAERGEALLWKAVSLAPIDAQVAYPSDLAAMALRAPKGWEMATGETNPAFIKVVPAPEIATEGMAEGEIDLGALNVQGPGTGDVQGSGGQGASYITEITSMGQRLRWAKEDSPLGLYVGDASRQSARYKATYATAVRKAFDQWGQALNGAVRFKPVNTPADAAIVVTFNDGIESNTSASTKHGGVTNPTVANGQLKQMQVALRTVSPLGKPFTEQEMATVALHEAGHALGLMGHSPSEGDVMHSGSMQGQLSARDVATIRQLYAQPAEITSRPPGAEVQMVDDATRLSKLDLATESARKTAVSNPKNWLEWQNYGISLLNRGKAKRKASGGLSSPEALANYRNALEAFEKTLELDESQAMAHVYRAYTFEEMNEPTQALGALDDAIDANPALPEAYREKAWLYAGLGDKIKANVALQEYLRRSPSARTSDEVAQIRRRIHGG